MPPRGASLTAEQEARVQAAMRYFNPEVAPRSPWTLRLAMLGVLLGTLAIGLEAASLASRIPLTYALTSLWTRSPPPPPLPPQPPLPSSPPRPPLWVTPHTLPLASSSLQADTRADEEVLTLNTTASGAMISTTDVSSTPSLAAITPPPPMTSALSMIASIWHTASEEVSDRVAVASPVGQDVSASASGPPSVSQSEMTTVELAARSNHTAGSLAGGAGGTGDGRQVREVHVELPTAQGLAGVEGAIAEGSEAALNATDAPASRRKGRRGRGGRQRGRGGHGRGKAMASGDGTAGVKADVKASVGVNAAASAVEAPIEATVGRNGSARAAMDGPRSASVGGGGSSGRQSSAGGPAFGPAGGGGLTGATLNRAPDLLLMVADDADVDDVLTRNLATGGAGLTPNLDLIGKRGAIFTNAHAASPMCAPSRFSIFTGLRPSYAPSPPSRFPLFCILYPISLLPTLLLATPALVHAFLPPVSHGPCHGRVVHMYMPSCPPSLMDASCTW